jgi:hypothetical protein
MDIVGCAAGDLDEKRPLPEYPTAEQIVELQQALAET